MQARGGKQRSREVDAGEAPLQHGKKEEDGDEDGDVDVQVLQDLGMGEEGGVIKKRMEGGDADRV